MRRWIDQAFPIAIAVIITVLAVTALPALSGDHLEGSMLLVHMMASGALVVALPLFALYCLRQCLSRWTSHSAQRFGYWLLVFFGLITTATIFACMLPLPSTEQMKQLMQWHGYAGFAMVPAVALLLLGVWRWRRIQSTRSATPG